MGQEAEMVLGNFGCELGIWFARFGQGSLEMQGGREEGDG